MVLVIFLLLFLSNFVTATLSCPRNTSIEDYLDLKVLHKDFENGLGNVATALFANNLWNFNYKNIDQVCEIQRILGDAFDINWAPKCQFKEYSKPSFLANLKSLNLKLNTLQALNTNPSTKLWITMDRINVRGGVSSVSKMSPVPGYKTLVYFKGAVRYVQVCLNYLK
jgi:hypothetical protein